MGQCLPGGKCSGCHYGYWGDYCQYECPNGATLPCGGSGHGTCQPAGVCFCNSTYGWAGLNCTDLCPGAPDNICGGSKYGDCNTYTAQCQCNRYAWHDNSTRLCVPCPKDSGTIYNRPNDNASYCVSCPAGQYGTDPTYCQNCLSDGCTGGASCAPGYFGDLCGLCEPGYYQEFNSQLKVNGCHSCKATSILAVLLLLVALAVATVLLLWLQSKPIVQRAFIPLKVGYTYLQGSQRSCALIHAY